jgi:hypothetical protein
VKHSPERDRRQHPRFPQVLEVQAHSLPSGHVGSSVPKQIHGRIQNVSDGGVCIMTPLPLPVASFVCCEIAMLEVPVSIPALMQVRWTSKRGNSSEHYINGLRFVAN